MASIKLDLYDCRRRDLTASTCRPTAIILTYGTQTATSIIYVKTPGRQPPSIRRWFAILAEGRRRAIITRICSTVTSRTRLASVARRHQRGRGPTLCFSSLGIQCCSYCSDPARTATRSWFSSSDGDARSQGTICGRRTGCRAPGAASSAASSSAGCDA